MRGRVHGFLVALTFVGAACSSSADVTLRGPNDATAVPTSPDVPPSGDAVETGAVSTTGVPSSLAPTTSAAPTTTTTVPPPAVALPGGPWTVVFHDEFDGNSLADVWNTCHWWQTDGGCTIAGSNNELEWYRPEGVRVEDGRLLLTIEDMPQRTTDGDMLPYRSGMVTTGFSDNNDPNPGFAFTYGYVEAAIRLPSGSGLWPAVWLLSADKTSLPEIDILEWYGSRPDEMTGHVHQRIDDERTSGRVESVISDREAQHVVGARWDATTVEFYLDGVPIGSVDDPQLVPQTPVYLILNLAAGGPAGEVDPRALPQTFAIDYVRVWQQGDAT